LILNKEEVKQVKMENILSQDLPLIKKFTERINKLEEEFSKFKKEQSQSKLPILKEVKIINLGDERIGLNREIPILLEVYSDEVVAKFIDAEVTGFGETEAEAVDHIKENIVSLYYELIEDENNLGPLPKRWLLALRDIISCK
jgi:hypothetical protein